MENSKINKNRPPEMKSSREHEEFQLEKFFLNALKDIYWAENHLVNKALPKMIKAATTEELKKAFEDHLDVTKDQVTKLENIFELIGEKAQTKKCEAMEGLTKEAETIIDETTDGSLTRDIALIMAAQKVEHYEIATYGTFTRLAGAIGRQDVADIFASILEEEKDADSVLTHVAENNITMANEERDS
jgi:ferritin-like metal-binding protein YciE